MTQFFPSAFYTMDAFFEGRLARFAGRSVPLIRIGIVCSFVLQTGRPVFVSCCANRQSGPQSFCLAGRAFCLSFAFALRLSQFRLSFCPSQACKPGSYAIRFCLLSYSNIYIFRTAAPASPKSQQNHLFYLISPLPSSPCRLRFCQSGCHRGYRTAPVRSDRCRRR